MLRTRLAQHEHQQRLLREEQEHARIGQLLHAYEQQLLVAKAQARKLRSQGTPNEELEDLIAQAELKRARTHKRAMAGILQPDSAVAEDDIAEEEEELVQPESPPVHRRSRRVPPPGLYPSFSFVQTTRADVGWATTRLAATHPVQPSTPPQVPQMDSTPLTSPDTSPSTPLSAFAGVVKATVSRFYPAQSSSQLASSPPSVASPPSVGSPLVPFQRRVALAARRLSAPVVAAVVRPAAPQCSQAPLNPVDPFAPIVPLLQKHKRRFNERVATKSPATTWKVRQTLSFSICSTLAFHTLHPSNSLSAPLPSDAMRHIHLHRMPNGLTASNGHFTCGCALRQHYPILIRVPRGLHYLNV